MLILDCEQGSEEWHKARAGIVTASEMKKIYTGTGKASTQAEVYMQTLLAEWRIGGPVESYSNQWMEEGKEREADARNTYAFESGQKVVSVGFVYADERKLMGSFGFLTEKPVVCVRNVSDDKAASAEELRFDHVAASVTLSASIEAEIAELEADDRAVFLADLGLKEPARDRLIQSCYRAGGLISFLTMGPDEVRAWTIHQGDTAVEAAARIHTDIARGFIRAETVAYDDLVAHTDMKGAKAVGKVRAEGKTYIVQDGDILLILCSA